MKYRSRVSGSIHRNIFSNEKGVLLENPGGKCFWWDNENLKACFIEYREPRTLKGYVNVFEKKDGEIYFGHLYGSREFAEEAGNYLSSKSIDIIEVSWTEKV